MIAYKEEFIKEKYKSKKASTIKQSNQHLKALIMYEKQPKNNNEFFNFTDEQLKITLLKLFKTASKSTYDQGMSTYDRYIKWAKIKGYRGDDSLSYERVFDNVKDSLKAEYRERKIINYISREQIYSLVSKLSSKRHLILYMLIFEGVYGTGAKEILELKSNNFKVGQPLLSLKNRDISIPVDLVTELNLASKEVGYESYGGRIVRYAITDNVFKTKYYSKIKQEESTLNTISSTLRLTAKQTLGVHVTADTLKESGMFFYIKHIKARNGTLTDKDFLKVAMRYNKRCKAYSNLCEMKNNYQLYEEFCNRKNLVFKANDEINLILDEIDKKYEPEYPLDYKKHNININKCLSQEEKDNLNRAETKTEREEMIKIRVGQGLFRNKLLKNSCECAICNLTIKELLIASHCKPWKDSSNIERLDVNNGMLLCAGHDSLFDKGLITFKIDGDIIISKKIKTSQFKLLNINESINLKLRVEQIPYIKWHKEKVFNKISEV